MYCNYLKIIPPRGIKNKYTIRFFFYASFIFYKIQYSQISWRKNSIRQGRRKKRRKKKIILANLEQVTGDL